MASTPKLIRIAERPDPTLWGDDELLTLPEAAALFWPNGPLKAASLRTAARDGKLEITVIAGKHLTTKSALKAMSLTSIRASVPFDNRELDRPLSSRNVIGHLVAAAGRKV